MKRLALSVSMCMLAATAAAENKEGQYVINPAYVYEHFDDDRYVDDSEGFGIGLEYRFGPHWATEIAVFQTEAEVSDNGTDVDLTQVRLDGLYYFLKDGVLQPYLGFGVGHGEFDSDIDAFEYGETQLNAGGGVRLNFNEAWSARLDVRAVYSVDEALTDTMTTLGISYAFGGKSSPKQEPPVEVVAAAPMDSDGDGVIDDNDQCPGSTAGATVDALGCALDSDGDGVTDDLDQCAGTEVGATVDDKGCVGVMHTMTVESIDLRVQFPLNVQEVPEEYQDEIAKVAEFMRKYPDVSVEIEGHTDSSGSAAYNKTLSQKRADAVRNSLVKRHGIDADRVTSIGRGEESPIADNDTEAGRIQNRRVVAVIQKEVMK
ncbi:OmpA family protein [Ketobacter sp. MCCC 1A13808]|uniref:OmpA family protein n=1 Tax=Ketobacter sp. MCCC 1A13808 TaxID=2602738 RepID=UPI000F23B9CD|nr:OmpA family protein [Ketobacter sp. MCCC 1A13808]MVF10980.1 OmpA family protein [Ketobacter sp. MCCC 1A13808]RLP56368.1 MAG: hypothetical protein D6160_02975 [Ketobacter sp.]